MGYSAPETLIPSKRHMAGPVGFAQYTERILHL